MAGWPQGLGWPEGEDIGDGNRRVLCTGEEREFRVWGGNLAKLKWKLPPLGGFHKYSFPEISFPFRNSQFSKTMPNLYVLLSTCSV